MKILVITLMFISVSCSNRTEIRQPQTVTQEMIDSVFRQSRMIEIEKDLIYTQYTLTDSYPYKDTIRIFQWDKIRNRLGFLDSIQKLNASWAILQNYKNRNGRAPLVKKYRKNAYSHLTDTFGIERDQSVPLYIPGDTMAVERYGRDGTLVRYIADDIRFIRVETIAFGGEWLVPRKYLKKISDTICFDKTIFVDRTNQNITTLSYEGSKWLVRSMNPATTGLHRPPYELETPLGMFVLQDKAYKMFYYKDGGTEIGGYAPYANRFSNGGYIHGVPVNNLTAGFIEFSPTLGTTPRSHMCVRNVTSHAKFIYKWAPIDETLIFVFD